MEEWTVLDVDENGTRTIRSDRGYVKLVSREDWEDFYDPGDVGRAIAAALWAKLEATPGFNEAMAAGKADLDAGRLVPFR